jgi:hypothetical protein
MKYILEYDESDIRDLMGDLETVGHADKKSFALWVSLPGFTSSPGYSGRLTLAVVLGDPFYSKGSLDGDKPLILSALQKGRFTRPFKAGLDWKTLEGSPNTGNPYRQRSQRVIRALDPQELQKFFSSWEDLDSSLLDLMKRLDELSNAGPIMGKSAVGLVYGRPGNLDLLINPAEGFRQTLFYSKGGVFYEDLESTEASTLTYPFA